MDTVLAIQWLSRGQDFITGAKLAAYSYNGDFFAIYFERLIYRVNKHIFQKLKNKKLLLIYS